jgi:hypothetical protein
VRVSVEDWSIVRELIGCEGSESIHAAARRVLAVGFRGGNVIGIERGAMRRRRKIAHAVLSIPVGKPEAAHATLTAIAQSARRRGWVR